jgi:GxxExxY protein
MSVRVVSPLPDFTERVIEQVIGCAIEVHRHLGPGFLESIYRRALAYELEERELFVERERAIAVTYKKLRMTGQRVDLIVANAVIVEVKAVATLAPVFEAQVMSYLKTTGLNAGLLINFNARLLREGLRRIVLTTPTGT